MHLAHATRGGDFLVRCVGCAALATPIPNFEHKRAFSSIDIWYAYVPYPMTRKLSEAELLFNGAASAPMDSKSNADTLNMARLLIMTNRRLP